MSTNFKLRCYRFITKPLRNHHLDKYPALIQLHNFILGKVSKEYIDVEGYKMTAGRGDWLHFQYTGEYEPLSTKLIKEHIHKNDVIVDIGANIGYYSILFSKLVGKDGVVYAFEPDDENYEYLLKNVQLNSCKNIVTEKKAVSDKSGNVTLYHCVKNPGGHSIISENKTLFPSEFNEEHSVNCVSLNDYFNGRHIDFVKMDVQGAEHLVFRGMTYYINRGVKILFEVDHGVLSTMPDETEKEIFSLLSKKGYRFLMVDEKEKVISELYAPFSIPPHKSVNIFCEKI